jgi:hypothetical protein
MAENYRQKVDQWAARHPQWSVDVTFTTSGEQHRPEHVFTYTFSDSINNTTTPVVGDPKSTKAEAKESAAQKAFVVCELWG